MRLAPNSYLQQGEVELFELRPEQVSERYVAWLNDSEVNRFLESRFAMHTVDSTRAFVSAVMDSDDSVMFGIRWLATGDHVGNIKLGPIDRRHLRAEIGLLIGERSAWGRGFGTAAIDLVAGYAFDRLGLHKVTAGGYASNGGSRRAFEKAEFELEGVRRRHFILDGRYEDGWLLARWSKV